MKIGLLAPDYSGKSCYLTVLYNILVNVMSSKSAREHGLSYEWLDEAQKYTLEQRYINLENTDLDKDMRFPIKTEKIERHPVRIAHRRNNISEEIEFIDFPGGMLRGDFIEETTSQYLKKRPAYGTFVTVLTAKDVKDALTECDAFIVLLDARYLIKPEINRAALATTGGITSIIRKAVDIRKRSEKWKNSTIGVPVALCVSKFDLLWPQEQEIAYREIMATFQDIVDEDSPHPVFVTGVSLGKDIENGGKLNPSQLENALEFCLAFGAFQERDFQYQQARSAQKKKQEEEQKIEETEEKIKERMEMGILEAFRSWAFGGGTVRKWRMLAQHYNQAMGERQKERETYKAEAAEDIQIGEEAARYLRDVDTEGKIYYHGQQHRFKKKIGAGFPLEAIEEPITL